MDWPTHVAVPRDYTASIRVYQKAKMFNKIYTKNWELYISQKKLRYGQNTESAFSRPNS